MIMSVCLWVPALRMSWNVTAGLHEGTDRPKARRRLHFWAAVWNVKKKKKQLHLPSHLKTSSSSVEAHCTAAWEHVLVCHAKAVAPSQQLSSHGHHGETKQDVRVCQCVFMCVRGLWSIMCPAHPLVGCPIQYAQPDCLFPTRASL